MNSNIPATQIEGERIKLALLEIESHKPIVQKSAEWLAARKNLIAASEAGYLLGIKSTSSMINYIKAKCNITTSLEYLNCLDSVKHGNIFEDVSRVIYELRNGVIVKEYGLITTLKNPLLGASPDGIVISTNSNLEYHDMTRIGRLVEIKNPYDYDTTETIKPEYIVQVLQQQYVLNLPQCDFIKTNIIGSKINEKTASKGIRPYYNIDDLLADIPSTTVLNLANKNIPICNLTHNGMEKGILIYYNDPSNQQYITHLYPLQIPYNKTDIITWIKTTKEDISSKQSICPSKIAVEYWYLAGYFEKVIDYNADLFETIYLPRLELVWKIILNIRQSQELYSTQQITYFIEEILKPHLKRSSSFYKLYTNQIEISNLLETAIHFDIKKLIETKSIEEAKTIEEAKKSKNRIRKPKFIIEYDF